MHVIGRDANLLQHWCEVVAVRSELRVVEFGISSFTSSVEWRQFFHVLSYKKLTILEVGGGEGRVGGQCSINKEIIKCCEEK